ncbi:Leucine-rich repeat receptor-like protein kinase PXL1 (Protein PHLOEM INTERCALATED WITH XYLEM-LIKE 1) [Durusdinium trenchii]|uniref:Leucine-rich repeat receptor-like protein kinase PXL1 (Protein PHLOEM INTERCALATED WITH XYLEM-LIKE 1) n=1 Tax=Durusdinium trenchii TaxID=1381693 RepID=A0ABP0HI94_9DINO
MADICISVADHICVLRPGELIGLSLHRRGLRGRLSKMIAQLSSLEWLRLHENQLIGEIPKELGQLRGLRALDLEQNALTGKIPRELSALRQLTLLDVSYNQLTGEIPQDFELGQLKSLRYLQLAQNRLRGEIPRELGQLKALEVLSLDQNDFVGEVPRELAQLENLKQFSLAQNQLTGSSYRISSIWKSNTQLEILDLSWNAFSGDLGGGSDSRPRTAVLWRLTRRSLAWLLWVGVVLPIFSLPSILFALAQSLPAQHSLALNESLLNLAYRTAPVVMVLIDMALAVKISIKYSQAFGLQTYHLLMSFRLFSAWLLPVFITVLLDENCLSGWKWTWTVCQEDSLEQQRFDWSIYGEEILNTKRDICTLSETWWSDGRCSRAIVGNLSPFLLKKLLTRSTMQPFLSWLVWQFSRLEADSGDPQAGRHLRLRGFGRRGPKTSSSLRPLEQMALLTTQLEVLIVWTPLVPLLSLGIWSAGTANLLLFDAGVWNFGVRLPLDAMNRKAALSKSYLTFALGAGCCFQLWHAFGAEMYGRYILLIFSLAVMGPWAKRFLPLELARSYFWAEADKASESEFIEMIQTVSAGS